MAIALSVLVGWAGNIQVLVRWVSSEARMQVNTALCSLVLGASLVAFSRGRRQLAAVAGPLVMLLAGLTIVEFATGVSLHVDELFWKHQWLNITGVSGRMALNTAIALTMLGGAVSMLGFNRIRPSVLAVLCGGVLALALLPLLSYLPSVVLGIGENSYQGTSLPTIVCLLLLALAVLAYTRATARDNVGSLPLLAAALGMFASIGVVTVQSNAQLVVADGWVRHSHEVRGEVDRFVSEVARMESSARAFALTGDDYFRVRYEAHRTTLLESLDRIRQLVADNPVQTARVVRLRELAEEKFAQSAAMARARQADDADAAGRYLLSLPREQTSALVVLSDEVQQEEARLLAKRDAAQAAAQRVTRVEQGIGGIAAFLLLGVSVYSARRAAAAQRQAEGELRVTNRLQRAVLDTAYFGVIATEASGPITIFNQASETMLGYSRDEVIGKKWGKDFCDPAEIAERAMALSTELGREIKPGREVFVARADRGEPDEHDWTFIRKDGSRFPVRLRIAAMHHADGSIAGYLGTFVDLSERKRAEAALRASEDRYRLIVSHMRDYAIYLLDPEGHVATWNEGAERAKGYAAEEIIGKSFEVFYPPEDLAAGKPMRILTDALAHGHMADEGWRVRKDGTRFWADVVVTPMRNDAGVLLGFVKVTHDITDRRKASEALRDSEERFRRAFDAAPIGIALVGLDGRWLRVNSALCRIVGYTEAEMLKRSFGGITHPDDLAEDRAALKELSSGARDSYGREKRYFHRDGHIVWVRVSAALVRDAEGRPMQLISQSEDITERKRVEIALRDGEERLRLVFAGVQIGLNLLRMTGGKREVLRNPAHIQITGVTEAESDIPNIYRLRTVPEDLVRQDQVLEPYRRGEINRVAMEKRYIHPDGRIVWVAIAWMRRARENSGDYDEISTVVDITERKQLEENLARARDEALEASRLKSEFLAMMSHEIRTPMNAVLGMAGLMMDTHLDDEQRNMGRVLLHSAEGLLTIINDILDFSKIEAGKFRLDSADFELRVLVEETLALLAPRAHEKQLELACEIDPAIGAVLLGDAGRIRQVLTNLVGNAIKFTDRGEVTVAVTREAARERSGRMAFRVTVRDTGVGIPLEAQGRLFQPFTQADGSATRRFGGTGLGLAISRQLIELMGGEIGFESEAGQGSLFWFTLELPARAPGTMAEPPSRLPEGCRVLIVDDNETNRRILLAQLALLGIEVEAVADGPTALRRLRETGPWHAVILDGHMPGMSGLDVAVEVRADAALAGLPLLMLSSAVPLEDPAAVAAIGFEALLTKPVRESQLHRALLSALGRLAVARPAAEPVAPRASDGRLRLLLAEDNPANQVVARMMITRMGHAVTIAGDGEQVLAELARNTYDAVLMDCQMPVLDGYETTRRIRSGEVPGVNPRVPVIALTAYAMPDDRLKCLKAGMNDYASKPIRANELREALVRCGVLRPGTSVGGVPETVPVTLPLPVTTSRTSTAVPTLAAAPVSLRNGAPDGILDLVAIERLRVLPGSHGPSLLPELVAMLRREAPERIERLARDVAAHETADLAFTAHALAGSAGNFGARRMRAAALALEKAARTSTWPEVEAELGRLREAWHQLDAELPDGTKPD